MLDGRGHHGNHAKADDNGRWSGGTSLNRKPYVAIPFAHIAELCIGNDLYWLAGLMEGEGSFCITKNGQGKSLRLRVQLHMTDLDVVERAARLMEGAKICFPKRKDGRKQSYLISMTGHAAERAMRLLSPELGIRRKEQIRVALNSWTNRPVKRAEWSKSDKRMTL